MAEEGGRKTKAALGQRTSRDGTIGGKGRVPQSRKSRNLGESGVPKKESRYFHGGAKGVGPGL